MILKFKRLKNGSSIRNFSNFTLGLVHKIIKNRKKNSFVTFDYDGSIDVSVKLA